MTDETRNWLKLADKFAADGDLMGMRAAAHELYDTDDGRLEGVAVMAEAALYSGERDEAATLAGEVLKADPEHLRAALVKAGVAAAEFRLDEELPALHAITEQAERELMGFDPESGNALILRALLRKAYGWLTDGEYLAANPEAAAETVHKASELAEDPLARAILYSKEIFLRNYRIQGPGESLALAKRFETLMGVTPYPHADVQKLPEKKLAIGYISPDFREHAVASFLEPMIRSFDSDHFTVHLYGLGRRDRVTKHIMTAPVAYRDISGRSPRTAARLISEDRIDILFDLSGHTQGTALPVMAYRPAPVQVSGIGYMATTGLSTVDYFLADAVTMPEGDAAEQAFVEKALRLPHSHLCYAPGLVREMPPAAMEAPVLRNGYVTLGCFNNFAKVTDEVILLWRGILDQVPGARLLLKNKLASIPSGEKIIRERLSRLGIESGRVKLLPYSPDYLESYREVDIALDTMPYNGGITTCEALYMGVPVISLRGRSHGARFGASILRNAGVEELLVENDINYVRRTVQIARSPELIGAYHSGLRANVRQSPLMDKKQYMQELEAAYRTIWRNFCNT